MQSRIVCIVTVLAGLVLFTFLDFVSPFAAAEPISSDEYKIFSHCKHSDYRTYIQCLTRQRRHHGSNLDFDLSCMEACHKKCEDEHDCDRNCLHCYKKTKRRHQVITEYEIECVSGDCSNSNKSQPSGTNITTNIDIRNIINATGVCCPTCEPKVPCPPTITPPTITPPRITPPTITPPTPTQSPPETPITPPHTPCCPTCRPPIWCPPFFPRVLPCIIPFCPPYFPGGWGGWGRGGGWGSGGGWGGGGGGGWGGGGGGGWGGGGGGGGGGWGGGSGWGGNGGWGGSGGSGGWGGGSGWGGMGGVGSWGGWGGCPYENIWLCLSFYRVGYGTDCSGCGIPYSQYNCDTSCQTMTKGI